MEKGVFPAARAEDEEEERCVHFTICNTHVLTSEYRRLLYVACTRAQIFLTVSYAASRFTYGMEQVKEISPFISCLGQRREVHLHEAY